MYNDAVVIVTFLVIRNLRHLSVFINARRVKG